MTSSTLESQFDDQSGLSYYYKRHENNCHKTLVVVHGLGCNKEFLGDQHDQIQKATKCNVLAIDLLGFGESRHFTAEEAPQALSMAQQGAAVLQICMALFDSAHSIVLLAHSMGGPIALHFLEKWQSETEKPFQIDCCLYVEGNIDESDCFASAAIAKQPLGEYVRDFERRTNVLEASNAPTSLDPNQNAAARRATGPITVYFSAKSLVEESRADLIMPRIVKLIAAGVSFRFLIGEKTPLLPSEETLVAHKLDDCIVRVPNTGHGMHLDNPDTFWRIVGGLLAQ